MTHLDVLEGTGIYSPDPMETTENDTAPRAFSGTVEYVLHDNVDVRGDEDSAVVEQGQHKCDIVLSILAIYNFAGSNLPGTTAVCCL